MTGTKPIKQGFPDIHTVLSHSNTPRVICCFNVRFFAVENLCEQEESMPSDYPQVPQSGNASVTVTLSVDSVYLTGLLFSIVVL